MVFQKQQTNSIMEVTNGMDNDDEDSGIFELGPNHKLSNKVPRNSIRRLVLIDGFNVMHAFKDVIKGFRCTNYVDERMNPIILVPLLLKFMKCGYIVRIVFKEMPEHTKISDRYILEELESCGLCIYPDENNLEDDDVLMLYLAKTIGAVIISNDKFRNHFDYKDEAEYNRIEYGKRFHEDFNPLLLKNGFQLQYDIEFCDTWEKLIVRKGDQNYDRVVTGYEDFEQIRPAHFERILLLQLYIYSSFRYIYNFGLPPQVNFLPENEDFPMIWDDFVKAYNVPADYHKNDSDDDDFNPFDYDYEWNP